jgi:hypothetical protein
VPVEGDPPTTVVGLNVIVLTVGAVMVRFAEAFVCATVAPMFAVVLISGLVVDTVKVADVPPAAIVTLAGTVANVELDESATVVAEATFPVIFSVAVDEAPPRTVAGLRSISSGTAGSIGSNMVCVTANADAVMCAFNLLDTAGAVTRNVPEV